jgi:menaquinone-dependent protoporphyrinogen oxidase
VAGALPYSKYNFFIRFIMRRIAAQAGGDVDTSRDYEYTDWGAVDRFASQFAADSIEDHGTHGALLERFISGANK